MRAQAFAARRHYRRYDTALKIQAAAGLPIAALELGVPRSTWNSWRKMDFSAMVKGPGTPPPDVVLLRRFLQDRAGRRLFAVYVRVADFYQELIRSTKAWKRPFAAAKPRVLKLVKRLTTPLGLKQALSLFGLSFSQYYAWVQEGRCSTSLLNKCLKRPPGQLLAVEIRRIKELFSTAPRTWPVISVYWLGLRSKSVACGRSTFYKYAGLLGFSREMPPSRRRKHTQGLRAGHPNEFWHADVTVYRPLDRAKVYIYLVVDNFSRFILAWKADLGLSARLCVENVWQAARCFGPPPASGPISLPVDGGPENQTLPVAFDRAALRRLVAQRDIVFSNSLVEAVNQQLKYRYLFTQDLLNYDHTVRHLNWAIHDYNFVRPHGQLSGLTPAEAFFGVTSPADRFKNQIREAQQARIARNRPDICAPCRTDA